MSSFQQLPKPRRKRFIPKYEVDGVHIITIGEDTQTHIDAVIGVHVNAQYPWIFVDKAKITESIFLGGELSEFFPLRKEIEAYSADKVLIGYIVDESKDTDDFYICCTTEARDHCKQQSEKFIRRQEKKLEKAVQKKPRPWISLGSDQEITRLEPVNTRTLMELEVKAKFPTEYDPEKFHIRDTNCIRDGFIELKPYRQKFNIVMRRRIDCASQITPAMIHRHVQTQLKYPQNVWTQSIADSLGEMADFVGAGDAAQVQEEKDDASSNDEDTQQKLPLDEVGVAAYKAALRRLRRPSYIKMVNSYVSSRKSEFESMIELNTIMDMYYNDYPNLVTQTRDKLGSMVFEEYVCFADVRAKDKFVSCAAFHPMWSGIVAISYSDAHPAVMHIPTMTRQDPIQRAVYGLNPVLIWSHIDSLIPKLYLEAPREVKVLSFCPFNENILVGGLISGQIVIWDLTNKLENVEKIEHLSEKREKYRIAMNSHMGWMKPVHDSRVVSVTVCSGLQNCHYHTVSDIKWLSPNFLVTPTGKTVPIEDNKYSMQFVSTGVEGNALVWNMSVDSIGFVEGKKVKKSKRVLRRPSALSTDVSPLKILDRILQPTFRVMLSEPEVAWSHSIQSFGMTPPRVKYTYTPKNTGTGRKYFSCEILNDDEPNKIFYFGSQHGALTRATWEGHNFNTGEAVNSEYAIVHYVCRIHDGTIVATHKNPHIDSLTLTVGGKIFAIWSDHLLNRPLIWKKRPYRLTDGAWSLYKPSILFIANDEGGLETWDLLLKSDKPICVQTLSGTMLTGVNLHTLPLAKNMIGVSDVNGCFRMFLNPPIFMLEKPRYKVRMEAMIARELKVMQSFTAWQDDFVKKNPHVLLELKRKEGLLFAEKEEEKRKQKEETEKILDDENEAKRLEKLKIVGPEEKWQKIIHKLIERTIAVKKRINKAQLIEHEKPLRELEAQRLEKERRMLEIMKCQKEIFNDTVAILFPEAITKQLAPKKSLFAENKETIKRDYLEEYEYIRKTASIMVKKNPYYREFRWESTLAEGKERRAALNADDDVVRMHYARIEEEHRESVSGYIVREEESQTQVEEEEKKDEEPIEFF
ncbi:hypothetical protein PYW08_001818 [Mythimna loreyi]|uniref:Uncharacterized protein n=1 Tax=Mythimna loreyi TaxID=667449 RepID=A0ACC2R539_9NEOP|nr:hypothetical protein PYW08_001818 [Mythimna loreyi]